LLVYSTCTYNREENERNIEWICSELGAETVETPQRFMPHRTKGEGFFIAAMKKNPGYSVQSPVYNAKLKVKPALINIERELLVDLGKFSFFSENNTSIAFPAIHYDDFIFLKNRLKIVSAGIALGETKGKDFIPNHALAMSTELSTQPFPVLELEKADALKYLRKESLQEIPNDLPRGHVLVKYKNCPLGFIKNIGNRANNLYPQEWRVRIGN
jgi:NOL1/NOP2/fmu family ribosome biogenesis protein